MAYGVEKTMLKPVHVEGIWGYAWSYQDENGSLVTVPFFAEVREFSEGVAAVKFICSWGYINTIGKVVIPPMFDDASNFCEGLARVQVGSKYGFINQAGEFIISPQFLWASDFVDGLAKVKIRACRIGGIYKNYDAFLNRDGQVLNRFFDVTKEYTDDAIISYQKTNYQIAFSVDQKSVTEVIDWIRGITRSDNQVKNLEVDNNYPRYYCLSFKFAEERAYLKISRDTIEQAEPTEFSKIFNARLSNELVYSEAMNNFPQDVNTFQPLVLKIEGEFYQYLVNWEHWVSADAFTGRYTYEFFNDPADTRWISLGIYVRIIDAVTHTNLYLDDSWRIGNIG